MANKKENTSSKKTLLVVLIIVLIVVLVGVMIFGYYQGWFDKYLKPQLPPDGNGDGNGDGNNGDGNNGDGSTIDDMSIHFINLGANSGDSIYIKAGDVDILIDAGAIASHAQIIKDYVDEYCTDGVLEYVIATHADQDHIAAFVGTTKIAGILDVYKCENIIRFARTDKSTTVVTNFLAKCDAQQAAGANVYTALECYNNANDAQRVYDIAKGIKMEILYQQYYEKKSSEENNYSVCLMFTHGDNHYLFTGDLENEGEASLVEKYPNLPEMELFKAGHHGSYTSSNETLLSKIKPKYVVASCAAGDSYKFPRQEFIDRVAQYTDKVYVTGVKTDGYGAGINGNVVFKCINGVISIECSISDLIFKESQWFKDNRTLPTAWQ